MTITEARINGLREDIEAHMGASSLRLFDDYVAGLRLGGAKPKNDRPTRLYVVGFLFADGAVLLTEKSHPEWQRGHFNGPGGKVEPGETFEAAIEREFLEETGVELRQWEHFATLVGDDRDAHRQGADEGSPFAVAFFAAWVPTRQRLKGVNTFQGGPMYPVGGDEPLWWWDANRLPKRALPNLHWLVPLADRRHRADWPLLVRERAEYAL